MHWSWHDLMALPPHVYTALVTWLNEQTVTEDDA